MRSTAARVRGVSLVAFLIAAALGAFLLLLAAELVLASRRSLHWQSAALQLERAGERALSLLAGELRMAGFRAGVDSAVRPPRAPGCGREDGWALALAPALAFADRGAVDALRLSDGSIPACLPSRHLHPGADLLAVRRAAAVPTGAGGRRPRETQWYLLVDSPGQGEFRYLGADGEPGALAADGRQAREWRNTIFYVRDYSVTPGDGVPALCAERLQGAGMRSQCLVEGVERLHLEFDIDRDGDGRTDVRLAAPGETELRQARRATIFLHLRSLVGLGPRGEGRELRLGSERVRLSPDDPFLHRVFVRTVPLANLR